MNWDNVDVEGPVFIGSSVHIEDGVQIVGPAWIGHDCHISHGARICHSVLFEYPFVGAHADLEDAISSGRYCVDRTGKTLSVTTPAAATHWGDTRRKSRP